MKKTGVISARVRPSVKGDADRVLAALGLSVSEAVSIFLTQVVIHRGLPFTVELPQSVDLDAFLESEEDDEKDAYETEYAVQYAAEGTAEQIAMEAIEKAAEGTANEVNEGASEEVCGDGHQIFQEE